MTPKRLVAMALIVGIAFALTGCANFIRNYEENEDRIEHNTIGTKYDVRFSPDPPVNAAFSATAMRVEKQQVKKYQVFVRGEVVTPYKGWRKSYEMPCGLLLVPASLCSHVLSVFTFGVYPFSFSGAINDLAFTGLNPFLNWESETRTEKRALTSTPKLIDDVQEDKITPLPNVQVVAVSGDVRKTYTTDKFGVFQLTLVGLDPSQSLFNTAREFDFTVSGDRQPTRRLLITRDFAGKLLRSRALIVAYGMAPSGKKLVETVKKLEELKFNDLAYALEKSELAKHKNDAAFMQDFNNASLE